MGNVLQTVCKCVHAHKICARSAYQAPSNRQWQSMARSRSSQLASGANTKHRYILYPHIVRKRGRGRCEGKNGKASPSPLARRRIRRSPHLPLLRKGEQGEGRTLPFCEKGKMGPSPFAKRGRRRSFKILFNCVLIRGCFWTPSPRGS